MDKITTILFDFDGVVADTEPLYDIFWADMGERFGIGIPDFAAVIKGMSIPSIFATYFADYTPEVQASIARACEEYERDMAFPEVPGALRFLRRLRAEGYRLGLVTSSMPAKMEIALRRMGLEGFFNTVVTAGRITRGKPDPMCFLLAADDLAATPAECLVFEDSFSGIAAATAAGMRVIGLATTNPADAIRPRVSAVIADFTAPEAILELIAPAGR